MDHPSPDVAVPAVRTEPSVAELLVRVTALEARVAALETGRPEPEGVPDLPGAEVPQDEELPSGTALGLAGRTCLILGGAFLLRTLTDSGTLPAVAGIALGLGYAALWAGLAHRSAAKGQAPWAAFQVFAAMAIAFPMLFETTVRLKVLAPGLASAALLAWTLLFMAVAIRWELRRMAWLTALASLATGFAIMAATSAITEFCPFFILASGASLLLAERGTWRGLRWPAALGADLAILVMIILADAPGGSETLAKDLRPDLVQATALAFAGVHLGAFLFRILKRPKAVGAYEIFQTLAVLALGFGGAVWMAKAAGVGYAPLGLAALLFGLACYACAFAFVEKQAEGSLDFKYLTSLAIVLVLAGSLLVLDRQPLALVGLVLGATTTWLGVRFGKVALQFHGLAFLATAAVASGLAEGALGGFLASAPRGLGGFAPAAFLTLAVLLAAHFQPLDRRGQDLAWEARLPSLGFGALGLLALGGLAASAAGAPLKDPGVLAALRTAILVGLAVGSAWAGRRLRASELPWLAYPLLGCAALKLLLEDLPKGRPATMFLAFTLFGIGLLAVPKLLSRVRS